MMKRTLFTFIFVSCFAGTALAQGGPTGIGYIPGMPVPQAAPAAAAPSSNASAAPKGGSNDNSKISKVAYGGQHNASVTPEPKPSQDFSKEEAALGMQPAKSGSLTNAQYKGVTPPSRLVPENESTFTRKGGNQLSWIGFMPEEGAHRIFIQTTHATKFERLATPSDRVELFIADTKLAVSNNNRELDMSFFQTPFAKAKAVKSKKGVKVIVQLKEALPCEVTQQDNMINIIVRK